MNAPTTQDVLDLEPGLITGNEFCDQLFAYLNSAGQTMYDEAVTQLEHGLQCALLAEQAGYDAPIQVAALLHDIGHLFLDEHDSKDDFLDTDLRHEIIGARFLTRWFGPQVSAIVALHVPAKRYLVATDAEYRARLSESSVRSLEVQGGPMNASEVAAFDASRHARLAVEVRRWDDLGKVPGAATPDLEHWREAVASSLTASTGDATEAPACLSRT